MIRYKIVCKNDALICEKKDRRKKSVIKDEQTFIELLDEFMKNGYKVIIDGKNLILSGEDSYFFIEDFNLVLSAPCLKRLRGDILKCILIEGYTKSSDKNSKKKEKFYDDSIMRYYPRESNIDYYEKKTKREFQFSLKSVATLALVALLVFKCLPIFSNGSDKNKAKDGEKGIQDEYLDDLKTFMDDDLKIKKAEVEIATLEPTPVVEENHDDEYREAIFNFLVKEKMTLEQFSALLTAMVKGNSPFPFEYETELDVFLDICFREDRSTDEMMIITMIRDNVTYDELDATCAGCVAEAHGDGYCYEDAYAVASTIINRIHDSVYVNNYGTNPFNQFKAPKQFSVYKSKAYLDYLGCRDLPGYQAAVEAFYTGESMHNFLEFRGWWVDVPYYHEQFVDHGNQYLVIQKDYRHLEDEEFVVDEEEIMSLVLEP